MTKDDRVGGDFLSFTNLISEIWTCNKLSYILEDCVPSFKLQELRAFKAMEDRFHVFLLQHFDVDLAKNEVPVLISSCSM